MRRAAYQRAQGTSASSSNNTLNVASPRRRRRQTWRRGTPMAEQAEQPLAQPAPAAPAAEPLSFYGWWERGVTCENATLVAFALFAFQKILNRNWPEAAFVATGTYGLARQKLYDPRRAVWLAFTVGFLVTMYYVFPPICHWLVTELVKAVHDLSSGAAKDPQCASLLIVLAIVACALFVSFVLDGALSRKVGGILGRMMKFEDAEGSEGGSSFNGVRGFFIWLHGCGETFSRLGEINGPNVGGVRDSSGQ